jgi:hypothetical protein
MWRPSSGRGPGGWVGRRLGRLGGRLGRLGRLGGESLIATAAVTVLPGRSSSSSRRASSASRLASSVSSVVPAPSATSCTTMAATAYLSPCAVDTGRSWAVGLTISPESSAGVAPGTGGRSGSRAVRRRDIPRTRAGAGRGRPGTPVGRSRQQRSQPLRPGVNPVRLRFRSPSPGRHRAGNGARRPRHPLHGRLRRPRDGLRSGGGRPGDRRRSAATARGARCHHGRGSGQTLTTVAASPAATASSPTAHGRSGVCVRPAGSSGSTPPRTSPSPPRRARPRSPPRPCGGRSSSPPARRPRPRRAAGRPDPAARAGSACWAACRRPARPRHRRR